MDTSQPDIFISHASADKDQYIYPLIEALKARGLTFWIDNAEIAWAENWVEKINEGLRTTKFALLCLSHNFLLRPWPEAELWSLLAMQTSSGVKRVLPLILNSRDEVLERYPVMAGLIFREFTDGPVKIADELARLLETKEKSTDEISVTVESVHTGKICHLRVPARASVAYLSKLAQPCLGVTEHVSLAALAVPLLRWVLIDVKAEDEWLKLPPEKQIKIHAMVASEAEFKIAYKSVDRLNEIGVVNGTVFHLYAIQDVFKGAAIKADLPPSTFLPPGDGVTL